ncbi:hypothetical protein DID77_04705, partial [Candidatus Marinamargulisbacteria bacterium SCGC AG-439-L15]
MFLKKRLASPEEQVSEEGISVMAKEGVEILPDEMIIKILDYIGHRFKDILYISWVNKRFNRLMKNSVNKLDLRGVKITDSLTKRLVSFPNLKELELSRCTQVTGESVRSLAIFPNLQSLDLSYCKQVTNE